MPTDRHNLEDELSAYLDGELDDDRRAEVEAYLAEDPQARQLLGELRQTVGLVQGLDRETAPSEMIEDLMVRFERQSLLGDEEEFLAPEPGPGISRYLATAAVLLLTVGVGMLVFQQTNGPGDATSSAIDIASKESNTRILRLAERDLDEAGDKPEFPAVTRAGEGGQISTAVPKAENLKNLGYLADKDRAKGAPPADRSNVETRFAKRAPESSEKPKDDLAGELLAKAEPPEPRMKVAPASPPASPPPPTRAAAKPGKKEALVTPVAENVRAASDLNNIVEAKEVAEDQPATDSAPDQVLNVVCVDVSSQLANAASARTFFSANNIEVISHAMPTAVDGFAHHQRKRADRMERQATAEPQYLIRGTPEQVAAVNMFFNNEKGVLSVSKQPPSARDRAAVSGATLYSQELADEAPSGTRRERRAAGAAAAVRKTEESKEAQIELGAVDQRAESPTPPTVQVAEAKRSRLRIAQQAGRAAMRPLKLPATAPAAEQIPQPHRRSGLVTVLVRLQQSPPRPASSPASLPSSDSPRQEAKPAVPR